MSLVCARFPYDYILFAEIVRVHIFRCTTIISRGVMRRDSADRRAASSRTAGLVDARSHRTQRNPVGTVMPRRPAERSRARRRWAAARAGRPGHTPPTKRLLTNRNRRARRRFYPLARSPDHPSSHPSAAVYYYGPLLHNPLVGQPARARTIPAAPILTHPIVFPRPYANTYPRARVYTRSHTDVVRV